MNIGSLIRGLLGDSKPGEPKSVELKEGQVVRGVVLSVSDSGKEAVVQIQGAPVRAELETPLQPGQTLNLQVAPPGENGLPVLKPVSPGQTATPQSMGEALESLGLTDAKAGREIVLAMQTGGLALTKETAAKLNMIMNAKPPGVPVEQWLEAAVISVKRGLPVTAESVRGLQQAVFGPPLHQLLSALEEQLNLWAEQGASKAGAEGKGAAVPPNPGTANGMNAAPASVGNSQLEGGASQGKNVGTAAIPVADNGAGKANGAIATTGTSADVESAANPSTSGTTGTGVNSAGTSNAGTSAGSSAPLNGSVNAGGSGGAASVAVDQASVLTGVATGGGEEESPGVNVARSNEASTPKASAAASSAGAEAVGAAEEEAAPNSAAKLSGASDGPAGSAAGKLTAGPAEPSGTALLAKLQGVLSELRSTLPQLTAAPPASAAGGPQAPAADTPLGQIAPPPAAAGQEPALAAPRGERHAAAVTPQPGTAPAHDTESWVGRVLKLLGAEHEQQAVRGSGAAAAEVRPAAVPLAAAGGREAQLPQALGGASGAGHDGAETLKGVLLQVMGSSEVPPAVKEAAGQLVQQLTGQQLLLNTDRTAPFAQVTLFLPLHGQDGQETASVHIQSRRGRKGELDAANCRLWFDLDMKQLGQTLVDVQVVNRIVSLKMHNNHPAVLELLEQRRDDIGVAVESIGYQLLSLRTEPLPEKSLADHSDSGSKLADYVPDSYKGVDYRI
ncbi:DNA ligase [Paenibacillus agri]|uniref:DNA ligase n=1 Tax=Paenibacillus agri TaxID=2744309 RepID=A0A850EK52_9BACL|nr:DNA ligase [Paenibacillus agri]NUU61445.1 DNA ligase [Paenibacillus agri]